MAVSAGARWARLAASGRPGLGPVMLLCALAMLAGCNNQAPLEGRPTARLADAALSAGYPQMALNVADSILATEPGNVAALVARGDALYSTGRPADAATAYRRALVVRPRDPSANAGLGRVLLKTDPKAAERAFRTALAARPEDPSVLANLGVALDLQERHTEAQIEYRRSLSIAPNAAATRSNLGLSLALSGDAAAAQAMLAPLAAAPDASGSTRDNLVVAQMLAAPPGTAPQITAAPGTAAPGTAAPVPLTSAGPAAPEPSGAFVQLSAAATRAGAEAVWKRVQDRVLALRPGSTPLIGEHMAGANTYWRLRIAATSRSDARNLCKRLQAKAVHCWVTTVAAE